MYTLRFRASMSAIAARLSTWLANIGVKNKINKNLSFFTSKGNVIYADRGSISPNILRRTPSKSKAFNQVYQ